MVYQNLKEMRKQELVYISTDSCVYISAVIYINTGYVFYISVS